MSNASNERIVIIKPVEHSQLDPDQALTLRQVRDKYPFKGRGNKKRINLETLRRWANRKRGFRPAGPSAPTIVLPMLLHCGELLTMPAWVEWFLAESNRIAEQAREVEIPEPKSEMERRGRAAMERLRKKGIKC